MNGVMIPELSAGSNQTGASDTWIPQVSCPSGPAATGMPGAPATAPKAASASRSRREMWLTDDSMFSSTRLVCILDVALTVDQLMQKCLRSCSDRIAVLGRYEGQRSDTIAP